jgi:hypothetical protein
MLNALIGESLKHHLGAGHCARHFYISLTKTGLAPQGPRPVKARGIAEKSK